jgi:hypothetical protein
MAYDYRPINKSVGQSASIAGINPELALLGFGIGAILWVVLGIFNINWTLKIGVIFLFIAAAMVLTAGGIWKFFGQFWKPRRYISVSLEYESPLWLLQSGRDDYLKGNSNRQVHPHQVRKLSNSSQKKSYLVRGK